MVANSVVDPNALNLDVRIQNFCPFWIRIQGFFINLEKKIIKNDFREEQFKKIGNIFLKL